MKAKRQQIHILFGCYANRLLTLHAVAYVTSVQQIMYTYKQARSKNQCAVLLSSTKSISEEEGLQAHQSTMLRPRES